MLFKYLLASLEKMLYIGELRQLSIGFIKPTVEWELQISRSSPKLQNLSQLKEALN